MSAPAWLPKYNPKKLTYHLPLLLIFLALLLHTTVDSNNLYNVTMSNFIRFISQYIGNKLSDTNFIQNPSFEIPAKNTETFAGWKSFGMRLSDQTATDGTSSAASLDLVTIPTHSLSQSIIYLFPANSIFTLSYSLQINEPQIKPQINLTFFHLDNTKTTFSNSINQKTIGIWEEFSQEYPVTKPSYKIELEVDVNSNKPAPTYLDNFSLRWKSGE